MDAEERFWKKVNKTDSCWEWKASIRGKGYGAFCIKKKRQKHMTFTLKKSVLKALEMINKKTWCGGFDSHALPPIY